MKTFEGEKGIGMSEREARRFLTQSKSTLILATTNSDGSPVIHPVWFYFDPDKTKLYFYTGPGLKKAVNIRERRQIYFDVDVDRWPYKGVKGRGNARLIESKSGASYWAEKILTKYIKKGHPHIKLALKKVESGEYVVFEITPTYFTSWDYGKLVSQNRSFRDLVKSK